MSDEWVEVSLGEILSLEYGKALPERSRDGQGFPVLGSAGVVGWHSQALVQGPGIVVGRKGTAGSVVWVDEDFSPIDTTYWVRLKDMRITLDFAHLLLTAIDLPGICAQTGVPGLNRDRAYEVRTSIPPLPVQRRIVDLMAHLDDHLRHLRSEAALARSLLDAESERLIANHPVVKVREVAHPMRGLIGGPFGSSLGSKDYVANGVPVIRGANMPKSKMYIGGDFVYVSEAKAKSLEGNQARPDDVIFTQRGTLGQVGLVPKSIPRAIVSQSQMRLRVDDRLALPEYVYFAFSRRSVIRAIQAMNTATANPHINLGILAELEVPVPTIPVQRMIVSALQSGVEYVTRVEQEISSLEEFRVSLLRALLSAAVVIPDSYDRLLDSVA
jgi:restriction endonuclease S subunit